MQQDIWKNCDRTSECPVIIFNCEMKEVRV